MKLHSPNIRVRQKLVRFGWDALVCTPCFEPWASVQTIVSVFAHIPGESVLEAVTRLRAQPVFIDIDSHMNIAPSALNQLDKPLSAIVLQHTFGVPCELNRCLSWAKSHGVPVIEDCCHALGSTWNGQKVGSFGLAAVFSFQWGKSFSTGQGGMVTFNDSNLVREVDRIISTQSVYPTLKESALLAVQRTLFRWLVTPHTRKLMRSIYKQACRKKIISGSEAAASSLFGETPGFLKLMSTAQAKVGIQQLKPLAPKHAHTTEEFDSNSRSIKIRWRQYYRTRF